MSENGGWDAGNARTWNERERAVYETGYAEGGRSSDVDWQEHTRQAVARAITAERERDEALDLLADHHANVYQHCAICGAVLDPHRPARVSDG